ncbi:hypothetical protein LCGC14_0928950 [marine sediment metagenome]|uniref:RNA polymerase sigma factor 70 region 4 type 2 domain-containing protein n=1 Tax=marine sediment metagenome TaxID=412755 RepID=A0A0F9NT40_9ZZZZ
MKRLITEQEEQAYRLCSPDFFGLTYENAAILLHCHLNTVWYRLNRLKAKAPQLFYDGFIRPRTPHTGNPNDYGAKGGSVNFVMSYHPSMDGDIKMKF